MATIEEQRQQQREEWAANPRARTDYLATVSDPTVRYYMTLIRRGHISFCDGLEILACELAADKAALFDLACKAANNAGFVERVILEGPLSGGTPE